MLRHVLDVGGQPMVLPGGQPYLALEGKGEVPNRQYTGTTFAVGDGRLPVINRHVALPWEDDESFESLASEGLEPVLLKFIVYLPGKATAVSVELVRASEEADLAVLRLEDGVEPIAGLSLGDAPPAAGDEMIVMGYPTSLRSMLAQPGDSFVAELQAAEDSDFWSVAARLAGAGLIVPLTSRGIVGQTSQATIVYDAETTHGGSGGPVLDINGAVIAVNTAILPDFSGSNLGVPVAKVRKLLEGAGLQ
jgi:S1-C subfamily serine protease